MVCQSQLMFQRPAEARRERVARAGRAAVRAVVRAVRVVRVVRVVADARRVLDLRGRPPSMPFRRDDAAFRLDRTEPRHAGQKDTRSILWI